MKIKITVIAVAILLIGAIVLGGLMFFGCTPFYFHSEAKEGQVKVACVGDSLTYGMAVANVYKNSYPAKLGKMLGEGYHVLNFGYSGKTSQENSADSYRATKLYEKSLAYQPDIVILMLGSNDTKPENWVSKEYYKSAQREIIEIYLNLESKPRLILGAPNAGFYVGNATEGLLKYDIDGDNLKLVVEAIKELADEYNLELVDTYALTESHPEWYRFDGVHPNKVGAEAMANAFYNQIKTVN